jgi:hypothetical protein
MRSDIIYTRNDAVYMREGIIFMKKELFAWEMIFLHVKRYHFHEN